MYTRPSDRAWRHEGSAEAEVEAAEDAADDHDAVDHTQPAHVDQFPAQAPAHCRRTLIVSSGYPTSTHVVPVIAPRHTDCHSSLSEDSRNALLSPEHEEEEPDEAEPEELLSLPPLLAPCNDDGEGDEDDDDVEEDEDTWAPCCSCACWAISTKVI